MTIKRRRSVLLVIILFGFCSFCQLLFLACADARAGGGRPAGSRGSRSFQAPSRSAQPTAPQREAIPQQPQSPLAPGPQPGGFMRGLGTAVLGGFLGSMLFSGLANAGGLGGLGGSGFGMLEILLFAGLASFLYRRFRSSQVAVVPSPDSMQYQYTENERPARPSFSSQAPIQEPLPFSGIDYRALTMMDHSFDADRFLKNAQDIFFKVQGAWNKQDRATLRAQCGNELMQSWEEELAKLRANGQFNRLDNIALRESEVTEVWTENGEDFITVRLLANLLDYTIDDKGDVVQGSNSVAIEFEEFWTFSRPVGPNTWKLVAVQQA